MVILKFSWFYYFVENITPPTHLHICVDNIWGSIRMEWLLVGWRIDGWLLDGWACAEWKIIVRQFVIACKTDDFMVAKSFVLPKKIINSLCVQIVGTHSTGRLLSIVEWGSQTDPGPKPGLKYKFILISLNTLVNWLSVGRFVPLLVAVN